MNYPVIPRTFFSGDCFDAYRILGAHPCTDPNGAEGWRFAVWAPGATAVEVCGGFDGWERGVPMEKADTGVWSAFIPGLAEGELYKYRVHGADGSTVMRSDPYAFATELRPGTASKLTKLDFTFDDTAWMERRDKCRNRPLNIYELHAGSWKHVIGKAVGSSIEIIPVNFYMDDDDDFEDTDEDIFVDEDKQEAAAEKEALQPSEDGEADDKLDIEEVE